MTDSTYIHRIAIIGAGGNIGRPITEALVKGGKHDITAITRHESEAVMPKGLYEIRKADYNDHDSLVNAMKGNEVLIITMATQAPKEDTQVRIINAAKEAGVTWIMPNEYGNDYTDPRYVKDFPRSAEAIAVRKYIEEVGLQWVSLNCGFWYEFSLSISKLAYGFDFQNRELCLFGDGNTKHVASTYAQCGRAVAALFSLPISSTDGSPCLNDWTNRSLFVKSFFINQREMLASVLHVTGTRESDWTVAHEDVKERYARGMKMYQQGKFEGFGVLMYARVFFDDGVQLAFAEKARNELLGLPEEDLDEATRAGILMAEKMSSGGGVEKYGVYEK